MIRHLLMHIWPTRHTDVWRFNVQQVLKRMELFNGQRFISIAIDAATHDAATVKAAFRGTIKPNDFLVFKNDPALGEVVSFEPMLRRVETIDDRHIAFYCHGKGAKYKPNSPALPQVRRWTEVMYANMLDYPALVEDALKTNNFVGTFKKQGNQFGTLPPHFHYAGTLFWLRSARIFNQPLWHRIPRQWWGTEAWPGVICPDELAAVGFMEEQAPNLQLYSAEVWKNRLNGAWHNWMIEHAAHLRFQSYREVLHSLQRRRVIVSGPQRSGTTIAAKMLALDLKLPFIDETEFGVHDTDKFHATLRGRKEFVLQAPTMSPHLAQIPDVDVVWMRRNLQDVLRSQKRIGWGRWEKLERDRYHDHSRDPIATVKARAWDLFQRVELGERAFDLDYESLRGHPLWVDPDNRAGFKDKQTYPYSG